MKKSLYVSTMAIIWTGITAIVAYTLMSVYFYQYYAKPSVTYPEVSIPTTTVVRGQPFTLHVSRCAHGAYSYVVTRELQNGIVFLLPQTAGTTEAGCQTYDRIIFTVPPEIPTATYTLHIRLAFTIRWLFLTRVDNVDLTTQPFTIIDHEETD